MVRNCNNCNYILGTGITKCPRCGKVCQSSAMVAPQPQPAYQEPIPVPDRQGDPTSPDEMKSEVSFLTNKVEMLANESQKLRTTVQQFEKKKEALLREVTHEVEARMKGKFTLLIGASIWTIILTLVCGFFAIRIYLGHETAIDRVVEQRLQETTSQEMFMAVFRSASKALVEKDVNPVVEEIKSEINEYRNFLNAAKTEFSTKNQDLEREVMLVEVRAEIMRLVDKSLRGHHKEYAQLNDMREKTEDLELKKMINDYLYQIETFFGSSKRFLDARINYTDTDGTGLIDQQVPTQGLLNVLQESVHWKMRAKAAFLLSERSELGVPDALIKAANHDPYLDVRQAALESFAKVTGYDLPHLFAGTNAMEWWNEQIEVQLDLVSSKKETTTELTEVAEELIRAAQSDAIDSPEDLSEPVGDHSAIEL